MVAAGILLATDFDGTLAPIRDDPSEVVPDPELARFLRDAAEIDGVTVAVISGRDIEDLARRLGAVPAYLAGSHGLEVRDPSGRMLRECPPLKISLDDRLAEEIAAEGMRIETKRHAVALHWRGRTGVDSSHATVARFGKWARRNGLTVIAGRAVAEARVAGFDKAAALEFIAGIVRPGRVIYAGDDLTDFAALKLAASRGRALFMRSDERDEAPGAETLSSRAALLSAFEEELRAHVRGWGLGRGARGEGRGARGEGRGNMMKDEE